MATSNRSSFIPLSQFPWLLLNAALFLLSVAVIPAPFWARGAALLLLAAGLFGWVSRGWGERLAAVSGRRPLVWAALAALALTWIWELAGTNEAVGLLRWIPLLLNATATLAAAWLAWREHRHQNLPLVAATLAAVLVFAPPLATTIPGATTFPGAEQIFQAFTVTALWSAQALLAAAALWSSAPASPWPAVEPAQRARDLLAMTRPIVVVLLLVTAYAGMVVGLRAFPPLALSIWTMVGGALSAGGAQAINQYVDRDMDRLMTRTAKRPLPAGRMTPAEGLAWGLGLCTLSVYLTAHFVNALAALLVFGGILYYVVVYTLLLKRTSAQNIVIGGGAGALAPVVGVAAATGQLDLTAAFLFGVVFLWTPPHFWALALVRLKDYARAGVPMLPVVRGEAFTRKQILVYAIVLVVLTLFPVAVGKAGWVYLLSALILNGVLLHSAWKVWQSGGNKLAWGLYRTSSMYLAFLFVALMADALIFLPLRG